MQGVIRFHIFIDHILANRLHGKHLLGSARILWAVVNFFEPVCNEDGSNTGKSMANSKINGEKILVVAGLAQSLVNFRGPLIQRLLQAGHEVFCTAAENDDEVATQLREWGATYIALPLARNSVGLWGDLKYAYRIWKLCRSLRPDVVFAYTVKPVVFGCSAASFAGVRRIFALVTGLGYVFTGQTRKHRVLQTIVLRLYRFALARTTAVFFQNPDDLRYFTERSVVDSAKAVVVNGSGVDLDCYQVAPLPDSTACVFLLIARLLGDKGIREFIQAGEIIRERHPEVKLVLVGPTDPSPDAIPEAVLNTWIKSGSVEYLGATDDVRPVLAATSVYVLPSYREGTPRTVLEAMATGRPIVTTDAPGCRETVQPGYNGFLVPVRDAEALANAMLRFIEEPELIAQMGTASRRLVEQRFDVHKVNAVMLETMGL